MATMATVRDTVSNLFTNIREVDEKVIRGEKRYGEKCYAVAYVDLADDVVGRAAHLKEFQERVLGDDFFDSPEQLRWNNYLYIVAGPNSVNQEGFGAAKAAIEANKEYARKRVILDSEVESLLGDSKLIEANDATAEKDIVSEWTNQLDVGLLDLLLDKPTPRTEVIERICNGTARREMSLAKAKALSATDEMLSHAHLRKIDVTRFRPVHDGKSYEFGNVTLIVGPNGSGKTSLLEAIEYLYCGHNRRPSTSSTSMVKGKLLNLETSSEFDLSSTNDTARIKARCLAWYRRDERTARPIVDGFTRYNFLDTDAAFRISTDLEPGEISQDLSRLLVGADAASLWTYLQKILSDVEASLTNAQGHLETEQQLLVADEAELKRLRELPSAAQSLTGNYRAALLALGWKKPMEINPLATLKERDPLEVATGHLSVLVAAGRGASTSRSIAERSLAMKQALTKANEFEEQRLDLVKMEKATSEAITNTHERVRLLTQWLAYCSVDFGTAHSNYKQTLTNAEEARHKLGKFRVGEIPDLTSNIMNVPLSTAIAITRELARSSSANIASLEATAMSYGRLVAVRSEAAHQLRDAALALLQNGHSSTDCPICHTSHDAYLLLQMIKAVPEDLNLPDEMRQVNESLEKNRVSLTGAEKLAVQLETVQKIAQQLHFESDTVPSVILGELKQLRDIARSIETTAAESKAAFDALTDSGLSLGEYEQLRGRIFSVFDDASIIDSVETSKRVRESIQASAKQLDEELTLIRDKLEAVRLAVASLFTNLSSEEWPHPKNGANDFNALLAMEEITDQLENEVKKLSNFVEIEVNTNFSNLRQAFAGVIQELDAAIHAATTEANASQAIITATEKLAQRKTRIQGYSMRQSNLKKACDVLQTLTRESSLESATQESLKAIGEQINDVFGRIHAPREYEYIGDGERLLQTFSSKEPRTLEQVSTGQRAAFALSIFLALNKTAKAAPPIILIDDPIAHIDDLNALSFIDYLRDLAVNMKRQIFFATADSRVAALFEKKFSFLGETEFRTIRLNQKFETKLQNSEF